MAEKQPNSPRGQNSDSSASNLPEFREMVDRVLNLDATLSENTENMSVDEQSLGAALLSLDNCDTATASTSSLITSTAVPVSELPATVADSLNVAAKQLSLLYDSTHSTTETDQGIELEEVVDDSDHDEGQDTVDPTLHFRGLAEPVTQSKADTSAIPKTASTTTMDDQSTPKKRHIMISYNQSCRATCKKIYDRLIERNYKVWMDVTDMFDDILVGMAHAVENSYIVLLCINQQYFESGYCKLEAEYAAENRIKFIPCLMEKDFRAQSWLGIIKGSNMHVDFSAPDNFDGAFDELIRQIDFVERKLSLRPRRTPAPTQMANPMRTATATHPPAPSPPPTNEVNSRRFDAIIREYKDSIQKKRHQLKRLKRNELGDLIVKLRQELFTETSQALSDAERSDEDDEKQPNHDQYLQHLLDRSLEQNEMLLRLVDRLTTPQPFQTAYQARLDLDGIIKVILAIMLLWTLNILCQKE